MKSYIQGLITGAVFVFAFMVLMGSTEPPPPPPQYSSNCCDEDRIISRILFCIDGASIRNGKISTYCNS
jgi:hypothetical protein